MIDRIAALPPADRRALVATLSDTECVALLDDPVLWDDRLAPWLTRTSPQFRWDWPYQRAMQDRLDAVTRDTIRRQATFLPPRHGKTELRTIRYPAFRLERDPRVRIIVTAYNQTLAEKFSRAIRRLVRERGVPLSEERNTAAEWETTVHGGVRAVGAGAGIAGHGADLIVIDDPIPSREVAESPTYRERLWEWYTDDLYTRLEPNGAILLTVTRWHHDDLPARILAGPEGRAWDVLSLPALAEDNDPLGRAPGDALCPDRFPAESLHRIRETLGPYAFAALYQGQPTPRSGNMFPRAMVQVVPAPPAGVRWCRAWDKAATAGGGKRTAGVKIGLHEGLVYVAHAIAGQWGDLERERTIRSTAAADGPACLIELEQEPGSGGKDSAQFTVRALAGYTVAAHPATGDKATRAEPLAAQWQAGNVRLVAGPWVGDYLDEMELAPNGRFVDLMDASAMAFNRLTVRAVTFRQSARMAV